jgi:hypothetical protein
VQWGVPRAHSADHIEDIAAKAGDDVVTSYEIDRNPAPAGVGHINTCFFLEIVRMRREAKPSYFLALGILKYDQVLYALEPSSHIIGAIGAKL